MRLADTKVGQIRSGFFRAEILGIYFVYAAYADTPEAAVASLHSWCRLSHEVSLAEEREEALAAEKRRKERQ